MKAILKCSFTDIFKGGELAQCLTTGDEIHIISIENGCVNPGCCGSFIKFTHPEIEGVCEGYIYISQIVMDN
jgi:hypothetical protein